MKTISKHLVPAGLISVVSLLTGFAFAGELPVPMANQPITKPAVGRILPIDGAVDAKPQFGPTRAVCEVRWQGSGNIAYLDWLTGMEAYAVYQDPTETGCNNTYPFGVVSIIWPVYVRVPTDLRLYPAVVSDTIDAGGCHYPWTPLYLGADTLIHLSDTGLHRLEIFLHDTVCVRGPYFAGVVIDTLLNIGFADIVVDSGVPPRLCASYNDYGHGPADLVSGSGFANNLKLWSRGVNAPQSQCFCCTGSTGNVDCDPGANVDIADLSALIDNLFVSLSPLCCNKAANCDGQPGTDIGDLSALIDYLYVNFTPLAVCQ